MCVCMYKLARNVLASSRVTLHQTNTNVVRTCARGKCIYIYTHTLLGLRTNHAHTHGRRVMVENERDYYCVRFFVVSNAVDAVDSGVRFVIARGGLWQTRCSVTQTKQRTHTTKTEPSKMWKNVRFTPSDKSLLNERSVAVHKYPFIHGHMGAHLSL